MEECLEKASAHGPRPGAESEKRKKCRRRLAAVCFALCALLLVAAADAVLSPKSDTMAAFYAEPDNTIDVLFVGGSHGAAAFDPIQIYQQQGFTSYNLFSWGQPMWTAYHYTLEVLKTQRPRVVVVEAFGLMYQKSYLDDTNWDDVSDDYSLLMRPSLNRASLALAMSQNQVNGRSLVRHASLLRYHNRWQVFEPSFLSFFFENHYSTGKGFGPNYGAEAFAPNTPVQNAPSAPLYPGCEEYLYKMIGLAEKEGFELVLAAAPYMVENDSEWSVYRRIADICAENGVAWLDYNQAEGQAAGIDFATDLAEHAHVNLYGAQKISTHIGDYLSANYSLPDRRGDAAYAHWQAAAQVEDKDRRRMRLLLSPDAESYFARLNDGDFTAVIVTQGNLTGPGSAEMAEVFRAAGLPTEVFTGAQPALLAVLQGGQVGEVKQGRALSGTFAVGQAHIQAGAGAAGASLLLDGQEQALAHGGVLVLVVDSTSGVLVQSVAFDASQGFARMTD